jgi:hypothetical protein
MYYSALSKSWTPVSFQRRTSRSLAAPQLHHNKHSRPFVMAPWLQIRCAAETRADIFDWQCMISPWA